jgi:farnesyl-diphosphate farnesyltransferase
MSGIGARPSAYQFGNYVACPPIALTVGSVFQSGIMASEPGEMRNLLRQVSRSFYLTLRILPCSIKAQLSIAYLLARAADTITDTNLVSVQKRLEALLQLRKSIQESCDGRLYPLPAFGELAEARQAVAGRGTHAERMLLGNVAKILEALRSFAVGDRLLINDVLNTITRGQEADLIRFGTASADRTIALGTDADLNEYTYCVAGCVGEFWTKMCKAHLLSTDRLNDEVFLANGVRFGKGLQLVNILRDLPSDLRQGRCYIPENRLAQHGLKPRDLIDPGAIERFRPLYNNYLREAEEHLSAGWQYTAVLPFRHMRIRLACAWPILIGVRTLAQLRCGNVLDGRNRIRLGRSGVRRIIVQSTFLYPYPRIWKRLFERARQERQPNS